MTKSKHTSDPTSIEHKAEPDALLQTTAEGAAEMSETQMKKVAGGHKASGSLDANIHFKYDIKAQKEA